MRKIESPVTFPKKKKHQLNIMFVVYYKHPQSSWTKLYDKRDDCNFLIVNSPFTRSNIQATLRNGKYVSWSDIPELVVSVMISLIECYC